MQEVMSQLSKTGGTLGEGTTEVVSAEGRGESKKNLREAIKS